MKRVLGMLIGIAGIASAAGATPIGPVYPPPTGVNFTSNGGSAGADAGVLFNYDIINLGAVDQMWWGLQDLGAQGPLLSPLVGSGTSQTLTYSGITGDGVIYTSVTPWTIATASGTASYDVRLVMNVYDSTNTNIDSSLVSRTAAGIAGSDMVLPVTGDFSVRYQFQALHGTTWDSIFDTFNNLQTGPTCTNCVASGTNGGFWYTPLAVPEPTSLMLFGSGLFGVATRLRKRGAARRRVS